MKTGNAICMLAVTVALRSITFVGVGCGWVGMMDMKVVEHASSNISTSSSLEWNSPFDGLEINGLKCNL